MFSILGIMTAAGGLFLFLWYRTLAGLPAKQQPQFVRPYVFKWGVPAVSLLVFLAGVIMLWEVNRRGAVITLVVAVAAAFLILKFDRYSANMRMIRDRYRRIRQADPAMEEMEALFHIAEWRYPKWPHDRLVELVAGKNLEEVVLLMIITDFDINPLADWELYRSLKAKCSRIVGITNMTN